MAYMGCRADAVSPCNRKALHVRVSKRLEGLRGAPIIPLHPWQGHLQQPSSSGVPAGLHAMRSGHKAPDAGGGRAASATLHG